MSYKVNRHSYHGPGVDGAVLKAQAEKRRDKQAETTVVHAHPYTSESGLRLKCNEKCLVFRPGYSTHTINTIGVLKNV